MQKLAAVPRDLAVLDVNLGRNSPSGVDVHRWLREHGFGGRIVYLTGHARSSPLVKEALELPDVSVLTKPISVDAIAGLVR